MKEIKKQKTRKLQPAGAEHRLLREKARRHTRASRVSPCVYTALVLLFLYAPMLVMVVFSFNGGRSNTQMDWRLSLQWYREFFNSSRLIGAVRNTLVLALLASAIATVIGTAAAVALDTWKKNLSRGAILAATDIPMMAPDIVTGISMMLLFIFAGGLLGRRAILGFPTMLIAHVTFCLPYVILSVLPRLRQIDRHLAEAAQDLGCTPGKAFLKVIFPNAFSAILTGALMAFTLSLDDFVISYFTKGASFQTLPLEIYTMTKKPVQPTIFALSTLIFVGIFVLLLLTNWAQARSDKKLQGAKK
ncbi:MAG: ABC transporter permease [Oscillospiraceae bacterium]|jgi:spermidine/putrescine transport system permease protein|nr:ABC transporter permease [Oscillospiraceae bacterium]